MVSPEKLRRLADAEENGSTAVGAVGVNVMLLDFHRQSEAKKAATADKRASAGTVKRTPVIGVKKS